MTIKETRPFPVAAEVVMRSTLFALANMQAKLQVYNEETGVIVATVSKWLGMQKQEVVVKVRRFAETSLLELEAPDAAKAVALLNLISTYITDGAGRVQADATIQWSDVAKERAARARRQEMVDKARGLLPGGRTEETAVTRTDAADRAIVPAETPVDAESRAMMPVPDNPGVLVKNYQDMVIELKVDPRVFSDRTAYLTTCQGCAATVLRGSKYCPACGRPLTLEAVQPELQGGVRRAAQASLTAGLLALAVNAVPFLLLVFPLLITADASLSFLENVGQSLTPLKLILSLLLGIAPSIFFGWRAIAQGQQAGWYANLSATLDPKGGQRATIGRVLGWLAIYVSVTWLLFTAVAYLFR